jgi:hypothetical protein
MDISHDHTDFGPQIPFLGPKFRFWALGAYFRFFDPPKVYFFLLHVKCPIDGYITRPYWLWAPNSVFGPMFAFLTPKSIYFLHLYKISDRLMGHMAYFIFEPPSASQCLLGIRRIPNFFELRTLSIKLQSILRFQIFEILLSFGSRREHVTYIYNVLYINKYINK